MSNYIPLSFIEICSKKYLVKKLLGVIFLQHIYLYFCNISISLLKHKKYSLLEQVCSQEYFSLIQNDQNFHNVHGRRYVLHDVLDTPVGSPCRGGGKTVRWSPWKRLPQLHTEYLTNVLPLLASPIPVAGHHFDGGARARRFQTQFLLHQLPLGRVGEHLEETKGATIRKEN